MRRRRSVKSSGIGRSTTLSKCVVSGVSVSWRMYRRPRAILAGRVLPTDLADFEQWSITRGILTRVSHARRYLADKVHNARSGNSVPKQGARGVGTNGMQSRWLIWIYSRPVRSEPARVGGATIRADQASLLPTPARPQLASASLSCRLQVWFRSRRVEEWQMAQDPGRDALPMRTVSGSAPQQLQQRAPKAIRTSRRLERRRVS